MSNALTLSKPMSQREFGLVFSKLAIQLRATDVDEGTIRSYFDVLQGVSGDAIKAAADGFAREPGRRFFPTSAEWLGRAQQAVGDGLRKTLPSPRAQAGRVECEDCEDTGWRLGMRCDGGSTCGETRRHAPHSYTVPCPCRATNQTYQRHQRFGKGD